MSPTSPLADFLAMRPRLHKSPPLYDAAVNDEDTLRMLADVGARLMLPDRPAEAEARGAAGKTRDAKAVWERMSSRGIIPDEWVQSPRRRFVREPWRAESHEPAAGRRPDWELSEYPTAAEAAVTLASDAAGVAAAEAAAAEWHWRASRAMRMRPFAGVVWRVLPRVCGLWFNALASSNFAADLAMTCSGSIAQHAGVEPDGLWRSVLARRSSGGPSAPHGPPFGSAGAAAREAVATLAGAVERRFGDGAEASEDYWVGATGGSVPPYVRLPCYTAISAMHAADACVLFDEASRTGVVATQCVGPFIRSKLDSRPFAEFANPAAPLLDVYARGYAPQSFYQRDGRCWAVLIAEAADESRMPTSLRQRW